jgi:hypothetical protein
MGLQAFSFEGGLSELKPLPPLAFGYDFSKSLFDKRFQRCPLSLRQLACLFEEAVRYLYGRLHTATHIMP